MEKDVGSIQTGKLANFTILGDNPVTSDPMKIKDIAVWGTVQEGRVLPVNRTPPVKRSDTGERAPFNAAFAADDARIASAAIDRLVGLLALTHGDEH